MNDPTTRDLVERAQSGDTAAFDLLAIAYRGRLESVVQERLGKALRQQLSVEDVVQETLLRAFRALSRFQWQAQEGSGTFFNWLCGIAVRVILEAAAAHKRRAPIALDFEVSAESVSPSRTLARRERLSRLEQAIADLPPDYQTVIRMVRLEGLSVTETAARLGRSRNAVSQLLLRALRRLRERFGDTESLGLDPGEGDANGGGESGVDEMRRPPR